MAAALQTAGRNDSRGTPRVDNWAFMGQWNASAVTSFYRGSAIMHRLQDVDENKNDAAGTALPMPLAAAVQGIFAGVLHANQSVPIAAESDSWVGSTDKKDQLVVSRWGACRFNALTGAGDVATPDQSWVGRTAWFHSDHEVGLTPPIGAFPIPAGIVIGYDGSEVLVDYTRHVGVGPKVEPYSFSVVATATTAQIISPDNDAASWIPVRRLWIARAHVNNATPNTFHATTTLEVQIDAGTPKTVSADALAATKFVTGNIGLEVAPASKVGIQVTSGGALTAGGAINVVLECYPLTQ